MDENDVNLDKLLKAVLHRLVFSGPDSIPDWLPIPAQWVDQARRVDPPRPWDKQ